MPRHHLSASLSTRAIAGEPGRLGFSIELDDVHTSRSDRQGQSAERHRPCPSPPLTRQTRGKSRSGTQLGARTIARRADARPMSVPAKAMRDEIPARDRLLSRIQPFARRHVVGPETDRAGRPCLQDPRPFCLQTVHYPQDTFFLRRNIFSSD